MRVPSLSPNKGVGSGPADDHADEGGVSSPTTSATPPSTPRKVGKLFSKGKPTPPRLPRGPSGLGKGKVPTPGKGNAQQKLAAEATRAVSHEANGSGGHGNDEPVHSGNALENYVLPPILRMDAAAVQQGNAGMEVIKVSKNGKQQVRRLGIAPNNRAIYITTNKVGGLLGLLKQGENEAAGPVKEVDLSRVVRMQLGQQSRRFVKARTKSDATDTPQSLSIIYRRSAYSAKDKLVKTMKKGQTVMDAGEDSLDLMVPSRADYDALTRTLEDLLGFYQEEEPWDNPDYAWIQYHLVEMGKSLGKSSMVSCTDWVALCKRWNAPVSKAEATAMYKAFCDSLAISHTHTAGLEMFEVVRLLEVLRQRGLDSAPETAVDPRKKLFLKIAQSKSGDSQAISAEDFLQFVHERQKETEMTLDDVKDLFYQLNGHRISPQLDDALSIISGYRDGAQPEGEAVSWEREYITYDAFGKYLLLDSNDVFDPKRASPQSYMNEPLNNYWVNTSHDTYLRRTKASSADQKGKTDLQSYTLALYRGARAIELDVWDGPAGPVVRSGVTSFSETNVRKSNSSNSLAFRDVILTISYFLQSEPQSLPVILLIENHCSLRLQNKMASIIEEILGKQNLLYRPDSYFKETDSLPSPAQLKGKAVIKSKVPEKILGESLALNDDFDDENRDSTPPSYTDYDSEDDVVNENVIGFTSTGSIKSAAPQKLTAEELYQTARSEAMEATSDAKALLNQLSDAVNQAQQAQNHSAALLRDIGMTYEELKNKREEGSHDMVEEGTEVELCLDGASKVKETADQAMEVAKAFAESVEESRLLAIAATTEARSETEMCAIAREDLTDKEGVLAEANEELREVSKSNQALIDAAERALSEARTNREYAENAERRVMAVRGLVDRSHNQAVSSETVAGTADAEAKISEQRANDAEARYQKARASADQEKENAEKEEAALDELEAQLIAQKKELSEVMGKVDAARERADDAVVKADKLTDEIRDVKSMGFDDDDEMSLADSVIVADQKSKERRLYLGQMEEALTDKLGLESNTRKVENAIDDLKRKAKLQAKVAASARRQADHSLSIADQLEEHALEEREAANLRQAARVNAKRGVESSDAVLTSTEAQLEEAEKAVIEANALASESRQKAEELSKEAENVQDVSALEEAVRIAQEHRDAAYAIYESAKECQEQALESAARAKQQHETNCILLANLERDAMAELLHKESAQQAELLAINACENARALSDQANELERKCEEAKALAQEKAGALEIATRYAEKRRRLQPISQELAKLTLLHSSNRRNWDKSLKLPNCAMHSIPETKLVQMAEEGKEEWKRWVEFNKTHCSRTYPASAGKNYNPTIPWAMGAQFVSMNFIRNKFMLLNDGRFRENGGQGYVLKPEFLCKNNAGSEDIVGSALDCTHPRQLTIRILSGLCIPKPAEKKSSSSINPFVRVALYDASPASLLPSPVFKTEIVERNGLNPVWNSKQAANFQCLNPSVGMLLFSVYDHCDVSKTDLFIGASAMPVSCIREGYRCVPLFDSNNARSGAMKYASLFIKVKVE